jgi:hypothetical protein
VALSQSVCCALLRCLTMDLGSGVLLEQLKGIVFLHFNTKYPSGSFCLIPIMQTAEKLTLICLGALDC